MQDHKNMDAYFEQTFSSKVGGARHMVMKTM